MATARSGWKARAGGGRRPARWLSLALTAALVSALAACCPATAPRPTAFTARLSALGPGRAVARLRDGRQVTLTGLSSVPAVEVYVTGRLLADGRVFVTGVRPLAPAAGAAP